MSRPSTGGLTVEHTYATPYCENAALEPLNGIALVTQDSVEVWCPTQDMLQAYWVAIDETGMAPERVKIHQTFVGGRFGRGTQADDVRMVVAVAKEFPGVPVKTIWSREECFRQGRYRTPIITRFKAVLGDDGYPTAVTSKACFVGVHPLFQMTLGYDDMPYFTSGVIPNVHISSDRFPVHVLNGAYRGPCFNSHAFFVETFIDECAVAAGIDPLEYRLSLVSRWDQCWADCLRVAAEKAGWGRPLPRGEGRGIAITSWPSAATRDSGTIVCAVAHVAVSPQGKLEVRQVDYAFDCGRVANPDAVRAQIEGGAIFGMNMTLNEQITRQGRGHRRKQLPRVSDAPARRQAAADQRSFRSAVRSRAVRHHRRGARRPRGPGDRERHLPGDRQAPAQHALRQPRPQLELNDSITASGLRYSTCCRTIPSRMRVSMT